MCVFSCGCSFFSVVHSRPPGFSCLFFFGLLPVIQVFDTARVDRTRSWLYAACSISYLGAMVSSNSALQFVNYPTQVKPQDGMRVGSEVICKGLRIFPSGLCLNKKKVRVQRALGLRVSGGGLASLRAAFLRLQHLAWYLANHRCSEIIC